MVIYIVDSSFQGKAEQSFPFTKAKQARGFTSLKGKSLEYAGELYSGEHRRKFTTEKAGFQVLKDPTGGTKLVLAIDRKPIAEWFKEQFDKFRQNIRQPMQQQRKSRGMKL